MGAELSTEEYETMERDIYEAALIPEYWPKLLAKLGDFSDSAGAGLLCMNERGVQFVCAPILQEVFDRFVSENWDARNSRRGNVVAKPAAFHQRGRLFGARRGRNRPDDQ
jgi:hypothetical protein